MEPLTSFGCTTPMYTHAQLSAQSQLAHAHGPHGWKPISNMAIDHVRLGEMWLPWILIQIELYGHILTFLIPKSKNNSKGTRTFCLHDI